jgi:hypothetical protein
MHTSTLMTLGLVLFATTATQGQWKPPSTIPKAELVATSNRVMSRPAIPIVVREDIFRIRALEMDWDVGAAVYEPKDPSRIAVGPDGRRIGVFILHGGYGDHREKDDISRLLAEKFGYKVVSMSYPGRLYLHHPSRDWPGLPLEADGRVRMPIWNKDVPITDDQYKVVEDTSQAKRYGKMTLACAKEGTEFHDRMSGWPVALEEGGKDLMRRHFPEADYSVYVHGHSTGGPFSFILSQRVPNVAGVLAIENTPFGYIYQKMIKNDLGSTPFNCLRILTWHATARYAGPEALALEGPEALMRLPSLMDEVMDNWKKASTAPYFKAEYIVHHNGVASLEAAAKATAARLKLGPAARERMVDQYVGYTRELSGIGVKPVPPVLFTLTKNSHDHTPKMYEEVVLPAFRAMKPAPRTDLVKLGAGLHGYTTPEAQLPMGVLPAVAQMWDDAIKAGYFKQDPVPRPR